MSVNDTTSTVILIYGCPFIRPFLEFVLGYFKAPAAATEQHLNLCVCLSDTCGHEHMTQCTNNTKLKLKLSFYLCMLVLAGKQQFYSTAVCNPHPTLRLHFLIAAQIVQITWLIWIVMAGQLEQCGSDKWNTAQVSAWVDEILSMHSRSNIGGSIGN